MKILIQADTQLQSQLRERYRDIAKHLVFHANEHHDYVYQPDSAEGSVPAHALLNAVFFLSLVDQFDYVVINQSLALPPATTFGTIADATIFRRGLTRHNLEDNSRRGRLLNLQPSLDTAFELTLPPLADSQDSRNQVTGSLGTDFSFQKEKPLIFVWPIFLAMGGVERNTIEIMKALADRYQFIVVSMERVAPSHGSLHADFIRYSDAVFDLAELVPQSQYLPALKEIFNRYKPDALWICNGNPWLQTHAAEVRELCRDVAIIDQQVYDVKEGWIEGYDAPAIQSFDRFIAVTERIRQVFITEKKMNPDRIDLIHSAVKVLEPLSYYAELAETYRENYAIDSARRNFVFAARMVPQKNPHRFLDIAAAFPQYDFIMIGDGVLSEEVLNRINNEQMGNVKRIPFIARLEDIYQVCDGLLITSDYEGLPIAMIEAMCMATPIFSTDVGDIKSCVARFDSGDVVDPNISRDELIERFGAFAENLPANQARANRAAPRVREFFSAANLADAYDQSFRRAARERRAPQGWISRLRARLQPWP